MVSLKAREWRSLSVLRFFQFFYTIKMRKVPILLRRLWGVYKSWENPNRTRDLNILCLHQKLLFLRKMYIREQIIFYACFFNREFGNLPLSAYKLINMLISFTQSVYKLMNCAWIYRKCRRMFHLDKKTSPFTAFYFSQPWRLHFLYKHIGGRIHIARKCNFD